MTAGSAGGKAAQKVWSLLDQELKRMDGAESKPDSPNESEIPRSQEDFERMMAEQD